MYFLQEGAAFTWKTLLLGDQNWSFLLETALRTLIMFVIILASLRILGKRGVKQLSVFELVVIIGLGSAAGDPMFYKDVGILPALLVFILIVGLYSAITYIVGKNKKVELLIEGKSVCLIKNGAFSIENFTKEALGEDEFFSELRMQGVSQLGQVEEAFIESSGSISIFYYRDEEVKYGLPIMPRSLEVSHRTIPEKGYYACSFCGYTTVLPPAVNHHCPECDRDKWIPASNKKRIR